MFTEKEEKNTYWSCLKYIYISVRLYQTRIEEKFILKFVCLFFISPLFAVIFSSIFLQKVKHDDFAIE